MISGLLAVGFQKYGSVKELSQNPIQHLFNVYVKINSASKKDPKIMEAARKFFTAMEQGDFREIQIINYHFHVSSVQVNSIEMRPNNKRDK